jgi:H2-forming N5,N10-methylenetetrahydromethanopterin dehydrogenase-like enzyme
MSNKVKVNIIGRGGQDTEELTPEEAVKRIEELAKSGKWVYLDQKETLTSDLTPEALLAARDITLANDLQGG